MSHSFLSSLFFPLSPLATLLHARAALKAEVDRYLLYKPLSTPIIYEGLERLFSCKDTHMLQ